MENSVMDKIHSNANIIYNQLAVASVKRNVGNDKDGLKQALDAAHAALADLQFIYDDISATYNWEKKNKETKEDLVELAFLVKHARRIIRQAKLNFGVQAMNSWHLLK